MVILEETIREAQFVAKEGKNGEFLLIAHLVRWFFNDINKRKKREERINK